MSSTSKKDARLAAREYFDSLQIEFRMIDSVYASTETEIFGEKFASPIMVAALSSLDKIRPNGAVEMAKGAAAAGCAVWTGIGPEEELEAMLETGAKVIKIVKPYKDTDLIFKKIEHAEKCGALAVGMDVDFFYGPQFNKYMAMEYPVSPKTLGDMREYVAATKLPFIFKGILSKSDARKALSVGCGAMVASHHSGSVSDYAIPPLRILPDIAAIAEKRVPIFLDGSVENGWDAFKSIAFGASGVCMGRKLMKVLQDEGSEGVRRVLTEATEELHWAMCVTGAALVQNIESGLVHGA